VHVGHVEKRSLIDRQLKIRPQRHGGLGEGQRQRVRRKGALRPAMDVAGELVEDDDLRQPTRCAARNRSRIRWSSSNDALNHCAGFSALNQKSMMSAGIRVSPFSVMSSWSFKRSAD